LKRAIFIDGGDPVGTPAGDRLNILTGDHSVFHSAGPQVGQGSVVVGTNQPVSFDHIETFGGPTALLPPRPGVGPFATNQPVSFDQMKSFGGSTALLPPRPGVAPFASDGSAVTLAVPPSCAARTLSGLIRAEPR
jgi:hypothetical protein